MNRFQIQVGSAPVELGGAIEPREYQERIVCKAIQMFAGEYENREGKLDPAANSVMIESPTGSGKTVMGLLIAQYFQKYHGLTIGWVAMRRNLLAQTDAENRSRDFGVDLELISMFDKDPPIVDVLIIDEAQHDGAMSMANLHCQVRPKKILGLTATPFRTDKIKLCFDHIIKDAGIHRLIQDGYLSKFHHFTIPEYTPEQVARFLIDEPTRWGKSLVFFYKAEDCFRCLGLLRRAGIKSDVITATSNRDRQLEKFESARTDVLINMNILTEGFDCPSLKTVFCRPSVKGCTIQMAGRVLRKYDTVQFKQIVQCSHTKHPFLKTALPDEQYVWMEDQWRALRLNDQIVATSNRIRQLVSQCDVELPDIVARNRRRKSAWQQPTAEGL